MERLAVEVPVPVEFRNLPNICAMTSNMYCDAQYMHYGDK